MEREEKKSQRKLSENYSASLLTKEIIHIGVRPHDRLIKRMKQFYKLYKRNINFLAEI